MQHNSTPRFGGRLPQSPEVARHALTLEIATYDATLSRETAELRAEIEPLVSRLVSQLERITVLAERACDVGEAMDNTPDNLSAETYERVTDASGTWQLYEAVKPLQDVLETW